jgi:hypothetical protein
MKYLIEYKHQHREDNTTEVEHDIEADTPLDALLWFMLEYGDVQPDAGTDELQLDSSLPDSLQGLGSVRDLCEAFLRDECDLEFWPNGSDSDIFMVRKPEVEDSFQCPTCDGTGRSFYTFIKEGVRA